MRLGELQEASQRVAATSARNEKIAVLADLLRRLAPDEVPAAAAWLSGYLRQRRIGVGPAAVGAAFRQSHADSSTLTIADVDQTFERIAGLSGAGSTTERSRQLGELVRRATEDEARFLARLVLGELRQGALAGIMEEAIAKASSLPASEIRRAAMFAGDLEPVAVAALTEGRAGLQRFRLELFRPVRPMLAQPAEDLDDALTQLHEAALEYKLDGARVQVHRSGDEVRVYSRLLNEVTPAVPELVEAVRALPVHEIVLDGEVIALRADGRPHPFQTTMRRFGRRLDVEQLRGELPLTPFFFDVIRLDREDLFAAPASRRSEALRDVAPGLAVPRIVTADPETAEEFLREALDRGHEGLMAKAPDSLYEAGRRGGSWLKVKADHTLDLVVLAIEWGHGRRAGKLSNVHLGARDPVSGAFVMLGKTFKGMTDEMLEWQTRRFQELAVATDGHTVHVRPEQVVEVTFNDVQASPHYPAGLALRFARVRRYRHDKTAAEADTIDTVRAIFEAAAPSTHGRGQQEIEPA